METMRQDNDILSHQFCGQQGGGTSTQRERERERERGRERSRLFKYLHPTIIKNRALHISDIIDMIFFTTSLIFFTTSLIFLRNKRNFFTRPQWLYPCSDSRR